MVGGEGVNRRPKGRLTSCKGGDLRERAPLGVVEGELEVRECGYVPKIGAKLEAIEPDIVCVSEGQPHQLEQPHSTSNSVKSDLICMLKNLRLVLWNFTLLALAASTKNPSLSTRFTASCRNLCHSLKPLSSS